jgi:hypothetical protein
MKRHHPRTARLALVAAVIAVIAALAAPNQAAHARSATQDGQTLSLATAAVAKDPSGDVQKFSATSPVPSNSIDLYRVRYTLTATPKNRSVTLATNLKTLRTERQSTKAAQIFTVGFIIRKDSVTVTYSVTEGVLVYHSNDTTTTCNQAALDANHRKDTIRVTVPASCLGGLPKEAQTAVFLTDAEDNRFYAADNTTRVSL